MSIALFDMDGTLVDFDGAMQRELAELRGPAEPVDTSDTQPWIRARRQLIKRVPGFWKKLAPIGAGFDLLELAGDVGFACHILTKHPKDIPGAASEKLEWCEKHVPGMPVHLSSDKGMVYGRMLVDDWPPYVEAWLKWRPRGLVISVAQPWNEGIEKLSPNIIRYVGSEQLPSVRRRMELAKLGSQ